MHDLVSVLRQAREATERGLGGVLATVVRVQGSAYRRPGARMFFPRNGEAVGLVSGGCLEADLAERAEQVAAGHPQSVVYDMRSPDDVVWGLGLGCNGEIRVRLERLEPGRFPAALVQLLEAAEQRRAVALVTAVDGAAAEAAAGLPEPVVQVCRELGAEVRSPRAGDASSLLALSVAPSAEPRCPRYRWLDLDDAGCWLVESIPPPIRLWLFGAGADAVPVVRQAAALGWQISVHDHREALVRPDRFPAATVERFDPRRWQAPPADRRTVALVMTHHFLQDRAVLERLLPLPVAAIGVLGPRARSERLRDELAEAGVDVSPWAERVRGPVGLDIGAETPEEIALSAVAELVSVVAGRHGGPLRERVGPLHD